MVFLKAPRGIYTDRLQKFVSGEFFADKNLYSQLFKEKSTAAEYVSMCVYSVSGIRTIPFADAVKGHYAPCNIGDSFGPSWSTHWFKITCTIPEQWSGEEVRFVWNTQSEGLIYTEEGHTVHGLTGGEWNDNNRRADYILTQSAKPNQTFTFYIEMVCNTMFGNGEAGMINPPNPSKSYTIKEAHLGAFNPAIYSLYIDYQIISEMATSLPENSSRAAQALYCANEIVNTFRPDDPSTISACKTLATNFLKDTNGSTAHNLTCIGHCHIDTAWLWAFDETKRKVARSWSTQCYLMDRYPEYKFACSQAQQYEWLQENYPDTFLDVKKKVARGQFVPIGGSWVEMDGNLPTGESFVRQFLYGQRYFEKNFGSRSEIFWLPDTFGYSCQLPQIVQGAGMKYFFTQKLSWNNFNKFPHTSFYWVGLDGTKVLTHFCPADTYCSQVRVSETVFSVTNHKDRETTNDSLLLFGNGDGGGGPTENMIERLKRLQDVNGLPRCTSGDPSTVYKQLESVGSKLSEWHGELYFELHRGTYTSQASTKKHNRKLENLLHNTELLLTISSCCAASQATYPREQLDRVWKTLLLCQFHDVLPGSSVGMVYDDTERLYKEAIELCLTLQEQALHNITGTERKDAGDAVHVFNALSTLRSEVIELPARYITDSAQSDSTKQNALFIVSNVQPLSFKAVTLKNKLDSEGASASQVNDGNLVLENKMIKAVFSKAGRLIQLTDKRVNREVVPKGTEGNKFMFYEDIPLFWDAWDVEFYSLETGFEAAIGTAKIAETGPIRATIVIDHPITKTSTLRQTISITAISAKIEFDTEVEWNENRRFLKVEFPVNIHTDMATYDVQYGNVQRPTHYNTSWDLARFEVCAHRFMDMSEHGYGVALLNDCKYGHAGHKNIMRLSLLRSPKSPDGQCDIGTHKFKYALYPHTGHFRDSDVIQVAAQFNNPFITRIVSSDTTTLQPANIDKSLFSIVDANNVVVDWVKTAEDSNAVIVRLCEVMGGRATFQMKSSLSLAKAWKCNLLEDKEHELTIDKDSWAVGLTISPFQVLSVMLTISKDEQLG